MFDTKKKQHVSSVLATLTLVLGCAGNRPQPGESSANREIRAAEKQGGKDARAPKIEPAPERKSEEVSRVQTLVEDLRSQNELSRAEAARRLGETGREARSAVPALAEAAVNDPSEAVRENAITALGEIGPEAAAAVPALLSLLRPAFRIPGTNVTSVDQLVQLLRPDSRIPSTLLRSVVKPDGTIVTPPLAADLRCVSLTAAEALGKIGEPAISGLAEAARDKNPETRAAAAHAFGCMGCEHESAIPFLLRILEDEHWSVQDYAVDALARIGKPSVPYLIDLLRREDNVLRGLFGPANDFEGSTIDLEPEGSAPHPNTLHGLVAVALGKMGKSARQAESTLVGLKKAKAEDLRVAAEWALSQIQND